MKFDKILIENEMYLKKVSFFKNSVKYSVKYLTLKQIEKTLLKDFQFSENILLSEKLKKDFIKNKINNKGFIYL